MTKEEVKNIIRDKAMEYGFEVSYLDGWHGFPDIISEELNFTYDNELTENTDWKTGILEQSLAITASVRRMGGQPTVEELLKTADEIRRGAELVAELKNLHLTWVETLPVNT